MTSGHRVEQVEVPAGEFTMGDSRGDHNPGDGEVPTRRMRVQGFRADATTVTNADFAAFVDATGHRTEAEEHGFSAVFHLALRAGPTT